MSTDHDGEAPVRAATDGLGRAKARAWRRPSAVALSAAVVCGLALWASLGLLAVADIPASGRVGMLPAPWLPSAVAAALLVLAGWRRIPEAAWWPALVPSVLLLPWLPFPVPRAFLLWTGPVVWLVWAGTALAVIAAVWGRRAATPPDAVPGDAARRGLAARRQALAALALGLAVYGAAAWTSSALRPIGDEPHYLIITQSILLDGDLRIENNHERLDYLSYYSADLKPDYLKRGKHGQIYSIHAPGLSALVAPAFAAGGYPAVVVLLLLVSAAGAWLVWWTSFALTASASAAWFGWAAAALSIPYVSHAGAVFPDGPGAVLVMTGVAALVRMHREGQGRTSGPAWVLHGLALALLPWLHARFAAAAGVLGVCIALRLIEARAWRSLASFAAVPLASAAAWFGFFYVVYGRFDPSAPYGSYSESNLANLWPGLTGLLLDQEHGLLLSAPVHAFALAGLVLLFRSARRLAIELAVLLAVYLVAAASYKMWYGGWSAPARFAVPVLLALGPCAAAFWADCRAAGRSAALVALTLSAGGGAVVATVDGGRLMFNARDGVSRLFDWACPLVDLPRALPSVFWGGPWQALALAMLWTVVLATAGAAAWWLGRARLAVATPVAFVLAVMVATTVAWEVQGTVVVTPTSAQLRLLDAFDPDGHRIGIQYRPLRVRPSSALIGRLRIADSVRRPETAGGAALTLRNVPAGTYRLLPSPAPDRPREVELTLYKSPLPLARCAFNRAADDCILRLPVDVEVFTVAATGPAAPRTVSLQPIAPIPAADRPARMKAIAAANYGQFDVFVFDQRVFLEPGGLWVEGGKEVPLVLASRPGHTAISVRLRNGPRPNTVHLAGDVRQNLTLGPGEERLVTIPLQPRSHAAFLRVRAEQGFRPSETGSGSRDERYLGVWIEAGKFED